MKEIEDIVQDILNISDISEKTIENINKSNDYLDKIRKEGVNESNIDYVNNVIKYLNNIYKDEEFQSNIRELNKIISLKYKDKVLEKNKIRKNTREEAKNIMKKLKLMKLDYKTNEQAELYLYIKSILKNNNIRLFRYYNEDVFTKSLSKNSIKKRVEIFNNNYDEFDNETNYDELERYYTSKLIMKDYPDELIVKEYLKESLNKISIIKPQYENPDYNIFINDNGNIEIKIK